MKRNFGSPKPTFPFSGIHGNTYGQHTRKLPNPTQPGQSDRQNDRERLFVTFLGIMSRFLGLFLKNTRLFNDFQDPDFDPASRIKNVTATKQRDGSFAFRITLTDGYTIPLVPMTADESDRYRRLTPDNQQDFLRNLAIHHLTNDAAQDLVKRIKATTQSQLRINTIPLRRQDYTPEIISDISSNLSLMIARFNVNIAHGQNREWEVGKKSSYDDLDTRQSGTNLTM